MAHKGKFHKLWFRRDFNNLRDYKFGYGEAYKLTLLGVDSSTYDLTRLYNTLAINTNIEGPNPLREWFSGPVPNSPAGLEWKFEVEDGDYERPEIVKFSIFSGIDPVLLIIRFRTIFVDLYQKFKTGSPVEILVRQNSISFPTGVPVVAWDVARWADYNP